MSDTGPIEIIRQRRQRAVDPVPDDAPVSRKHTKSELLDMLTDQIRDELGPDASATVVGKVDAVAKRVGEMAKREDADDPAKQIGEAVGAAVATALAAFMSGGGGARPGRHTLAAAGLVVIGLLGSPVVEQRFHSGAIERVEAKIDKMDRTVNGLSQYTWDLDRCKKDPSIPCPTQPPASVRIAAAEAEQDTSQ